MKNWRTKMSDAERLFKENPLKALWIKVSEIDKKMDIILAELDSDDEDNNNYSDNGDTNQNGY